MPETEILRQALRAFAGMDDEAFELSLPFWHSKQYGKGEFYNEYKNVCRHLGFIIDGVFRAYYVHGDSGEERNVFFFSRQLVVVSYKSFITQTPCNYYTEALTEARILYISFDDLNALYRKSQQWERFGRLVAETAFNIAMNRTEDFLFQTPEQRYLELMKQHPDIFNNISLFHIASYLGIQQPSLSRIRKRMAETRI